MKYNRIFSALAGCVASLAMVSCSIDTESAINDGKEMTFTASFENGTRTTLQDEYSISWSPQEEINIFYGSRSQGRFVSMNTSSSAVADFKGTLDLSSGATENGSVSTDYWAVYPYSKDNECDGESVTLTLPSTQTSPEGSFGDRMFPSVARSNSMSLSFYNVCGGIKFSVTRQDITSVTLEGNNGESLAGKVQVSFDGSGVPAATVLEGADKITLTPAGSTTFIKDSYYFITVLPTELTSGFKLSFRTVDGKIGEMTKDASVSIDRSIFAVIASADTRVSSWEDDTTPTIFTNRSGLYLGINGFNQTLSSFPITKATSSNKSEFDSFINSFAAKNGTLLYYSVERSLDALQKASLPVDLANVAVVTFTDGLDQGSLMMNSSYSTDDEYLNAINTRLKNEKVSGVNLTAYSIGLRGSDVSDVTKFRNNLKKLASSDGNAYEVSSMSEVATKFKEIANVAKASSYFTYNLSFTIPGQATGTKIRFTFDNVSNASYSSLYIEGTFNLASRSLEDITCQGFNSPAESTISGKVDGIFVTFDFKGIGRTDESKLDMSYVKQWSCAPSSSTWQINSEFDKDTDVSMNVEVSRKSAAVMLILDCSSSLGSQFSTMQSNARSFISTLFEASKDEYTVESVTLSASELAIREGKSKTLVTTIAPTTAIDQSIVWTSSDPSVATVSASGVVTGKKQGGTCIITATASNGASAQCKVTVLEPIEQLVDLGLSVKWATCNLGADSPEEYGRYFAWGDVVGQTWNGSSWSGGGFYNYPSYQLDANNNLKPEYDAAHVNLGGSWRMPTYSEFQELINNCTCTWTSNYNGTGVAGRIFTSKKTGYTDKFLFLPAAGYGDGTNLRGAGSCGSYWSSTSYSDYDAWSLSFDSGNVFTYSYYYRYCGRSVRPVTE